MGFSKMHAFKVDITNEKEVKWMANKIRTEIGNVTVVVMAAAPTFKVINTKLKIISIFK